MAEPAADPMAALRRAMEAQARATGRIDVRKVDEQLAAGNPIPPDADVVAEQTGNWRAMLPDKGDVAEQQDLSEAERAMIESRGEQLRLDPARDMPGRYHADGPDTERVAAGRVTPRSGTQRAAVLEALRAAGDRGATDHELWVATEAKCVRPHVAGTRREELIRDGWTIVDTGERRLTDTGTPAIVWRLAE